MVWHVLCVWFLLAGQRITVLLLLLSALDPLWGLGAAVFRVFETLTKNRE
jgi:hypothetical protein